MKSISARELHVNTNSVMKRVAEGESFVIEKRGLPIAELRPFPAVPARRRFPDREKLLATLPLVRTDSGRILEEERS